MKSGIYAFMLIAILGVTPQCCAQAQSTATSIDELKKETQDLLHTIGSYTAERRDEAVQKTKEGLYKLDKRIESLETKTDNNWEKMNETARKESRENLRAIHKQRNQVAEWYGSMKTSSAGTWGHVKKGFSDAYTALENAWEKSDKEF